MANFNSILSLVLGLWKKEYFAFVTLKQSLFKINNSVNLWSLRLNLEKRFPVFLLK